MASTRIVGRTDKKDDFTTSESAREKHAINEFKRSGGFDRIRKDTLREWESSDEGAAFLASLKKIVSDEVERDATLLARDRGKAATLVSGSVERSQLYQDARLAASKKIFQSEAFKMRIYESVKQYFAQAEESAVKDETSAQKDEKTGEQQNVTAQEAALDFIKREGGT